MSIVTEGVLLSLPFSLLAELANALADALDELEAIELTLDDEATRRFWHAHGNLSGLHDRLSQWCEEYDVVSAADAPRPPRGGLGPEAISD